MMMTVESSVSSLNKLQNNKTNRMIKREAMMIRLYRSRLGNRNKNETSRRKLLCLMKLLEREFLKRVPQNKMMMKMKVTLFIHDHRVN